MLKAPEHQVAGHFAGDSELGTVIDGRGLFFKPLQSSDRGSTEVNLYTSSDPRVPSALRARFFPSFRGTQLLSTGIGPQHPHLALEDLTADLTRASVVDFKIMSHTWAPTHPLALGFCVYSLQIYGGGRSADGDCWKPSRDDVRKFTRADVRRILRRFVSHGNDLDCGLAKEMMQINVGQLQFWCQYWVIVAILTTFERFFDIFFSWLPLYAETKLAFFIYLRHLKAMGMRWVYAAFLRSLVAQYEPKIEERMMRFRVRSGDLLLFYIKNFTDKGKNMFLELLHMVITQPTRSSSALLKPDEETDTLNQEEEFSLSQHFFIKSHDLA